jgi:hypothetical protein
MLLLLLLLLRGAVAGRWLLLTAARCTLTCCLSLPLPLLLPSCTAATAGGGAGLRAPPALGLSTSSRALSAPTESLPCLLPPRLPTLALLC